MLNSGKKIRALRDQKKKFELLCCPKYAHREIY